MTTLAVLRQLRAWSCPSCETFNGSVAWRCRGCLLGRPPGAAS